MSAGLAVLLHAGIALSRYVPASTGHAWGATERDRAAEVDVDVTPEATPVRPPPEDEPSAPRVAASSTSTRGRRVSREGPAATPNDRPLEAGAAPPLPGHTEARPEGREDVPSPGRRLGWKDLGLGGGIRAAAMALPPDAAVERGADIGGLRQGMTDRDTQLGLGPGGRIANEVRRLSRDVAPLDTRATIVVSVDGGGRVTGISLGDVTSHDAEWIKVIRILRQELIELPGWRGGGVRVTLGIRSIAAPRSGAGGPLSFDVSNIGSPEMHHFHVHVVQQVRSP